MAVIGGRPPERGPRNHWCTGQPAAGKHYLGWVAGPAVYIEAHLGPRTRCCVREYRGPDALCDGCRFTLRRDSVWYLPIWREIDDAGIAVLVHRDQLPTLEALRTHEQIRIGRGTRQSDGVWIAPTKGPMYSTNCLERQGDADICDWLPVLWKYRGIITGDMLRAGPLVAAAVQIQAPPPPPPVLAPAAQLELSAAIISQQFTVRGQDGPPPLDGAMADVFKRRGLPTTPKKNGKH